MERFERLRTVAVPLLRPYIRSLAVLGSYARGEETAESDIDLLVELKPVGERPSLGLHRVSSKSALIRSTRVYLRSIFRLS